MALRAPRSVPDPEHPAFETYFRVRFHEVDGLGHANNAAYLNYLEQAAIDHATFLGLDLQRLQALGGVFVARRHEVVFLKPTFTGDLLRVVTWSGMPAEDTLVAQATTEWVFASNQGRPRRIPNEVVSLFRAGH